MLFVLQLIESLILLLLLQGDLVSPLHFVALKMDMLELSYAPNIYTHFLILCSHPEVVGRLWKARVIRSDYATRKTEAKQDLRNE